MPKTLYHIAFFFLFVFSASSLANQIIKVGVGNFPPFFIEESSEGIFIEIVEEIFKQIPEYEVEYFFMSNRRILHEINYGKSIDVACNIFPSSKVNAHLSEPVFRYRDVAVSLKSDQLKVNNISELKGKSIAAYQGATDLLGGEFKTMAQNNTGYSEHAHPKETTHLMVSGSKDIRIGDINIFLYDLKNKNYNNNNNINVERSNFTVHYLWPYVYSHMAFKDPSLKDTVDKVINELKLNGSIDKIYAKHKMQ